MKWYKYDILDLTDAEYTKWYSLMSQEKRQRVDKFRFETDKKRSVAGEMLARKAISEWCGVAPESIVFGKKEHGKPFVKDLAVEFNISHSGDMVVCAVDDKPVGIDVEKIRPVDLKVAKRIFIDVELLYLFGYKPTEQDFIPTENIAVLTRFFKLWTSKEATVKCMGTGVADIKMPVSENVKIFTFDDYVVSISGEE